MQQNASSNINDTPVNAYKFGAFDQYVSFCALGGLITSDDGKISSMTTLQFCQQFNVDRKTTYRWRQTTGFAERVRVRREEIFPLARETACWNRLYLIGNQSNDLKAGVQALALLLGHFSGLMAPSRYNERIVNQNQGSLSDLLMKVNVEGLSND